MSYVECKKGEMLLVMGRFVRCWRLARLSMAVLWVLLFLASGQGMAQQPVGKEGTDSTVLPQRPYLSRLSVGGYGEAMMSRNFYSDAWQRYTHPEQYKDDKSHGRADLPHVVIFLGYDFGRDWTLGKEIEFEHGGTESAIELEAEESGEYEREVERGGEVALEQFWLQKSFYPGLNLRLGHIIVPVGLTNQHHLPLEFFTAYRQEGEYTILPCTWHETGASLWGRLGDFRYEAVFVPGLDADRFGAEKFIHGGAGSPYEFKIANAYAGALRFDYYAPFGLRVGLSGYAGQSFHNSLTKNTRYKEKKGNVYIGAFDFHFDRFGVVARGNFDYAHLTDSYEITRFNRNSMAKGAPSPRTPVASDAIVGSVELGYDIFSLIPSLASKQKFYLFGHAEYYNSMYKTAPAVLALQWCGKYRYAGGINYYPLPQIVIKAEYSYRKYKAPFNDEPSVTLGIAYSGFFL